MIRSTYLTDQEHAAVDALAIEQNVAWNTIVRIGVRLLVGLPVDEWARDLQRESEGARNDRAAR